MYTDFRPTPLQHYVFPAGGDGLYMVVDEKSTFREDNFQKAVTVLTEAAQEGAAAKRKGKKGAKGQTALESEESDIYKLVRMIMERQYDPVSGPPLLDSSGGPSQGACHLKSSLLLLLQPHLHCQCILGLHADCVLFACR